MHPLLQINAQLAVSADDDIGADAGFLRNIAAGVGDAGICAVIGFGIGGLRFARRNQRACVKLRRLCRYRQQQKRQAYRKACGNKSPACF